MIKIENISCSYGKQEVLRQISFHLALGERLCIIGANGSGKSTLLHAIMGLAESKGNISVQGKPLEALSWKERAKKMALLSQHSTIEFPYTVWETVALGRYCHRKNAFSSISSPEKEIIGQCIQDLGLWELRNQLISQLSGGQLQRVYLARTFAQNPQVILLDEPTNHLDLKVQLALLQQLSQWVSQGNHALIGVFHDLNLVRGFADKVLLLHQGNQLAFGTVDQVMTQENLISAYGMNVTEFMENSYQKWCKP